MTQEYGTIRSQSVPQDVCGLEGGIAERTRQVPLLLTVQSVVPMLQPFFSDAFMPKATVTILQAAGEKHPCRHHPRDVRAR